MPKTAGAATDLQGKEGTVVSDVSVYKGSPTSATLPIRVEFEDPKFVAHLVCSRDATTCNPMMLKLCLIT